MATSARRWPETTYTYDSNGNLTSKTEGSDVWTYTWNAENQLTKVEKNSIEQARFAYDPLGRRVEKVAVGVTTTYTYDNEDILREVRGSTTFKYVHGSGIDEPIAREDGSGALTYYHADGLGSIARRTNVSGTVVHDYRYDAWGSIETGASESGHAFTGREWDPETGLYYYRARYYDPRGGRFVSEDPIRLAAGGPNLYAYVRDRPTTMVDPAGLKETCTWVGVTGTAAYVIGGQVITQAGRCRDEFGCVRDRTRNCLCFTIGWGASGTFGAERGDDSTSNEGWGASSPFGSASGTPEGVTGGGVGPGWGIFYSWCNCDVR